MFSPAGAGAIPRTVQSRLQDTVSFLDYAPSRTGGNLSSLLQTALAETAAAGRTLLVPNDGIAWPFNTALTVATGARLVFAPGAQAITTLTGTLFTFAGPATILGLRLTGGHNSTSYVAFIQAAANGSVFDDFEISNSNSGIRCDAAECVIRGRFNEMRGAGVRLSGTTAVRNRVDVVIRNAAGFGVYVTAGATENEIWVTDYADPARFTTWQLANRPETAQGRVGIEGCGITQDAPGNIVHRMIRRGSGDAGMTLSSDNNVVGLCVAENCVGSGLSALGSYNSAGVVRAIGCSNGIAFTPGSGGLAQSNIVSVAYVRGNSYGVLNDTESYREWVSGATYGTGTNFMANGLNIYKSIAEVPTFGTIPPVHTSGTVSDGVADWIYVNTYGGLADADNNVVGTLIAAGNTTADVFNGSSGRLVIGQALGGATGLPANGTLVPSTKGTLAGNPRGVDVVDNQRTRIFSSQVASGDYSGILWGQQNRVTQVNAMVGGYDCVALAVSAIAEGYSCTADGPYSRSHGRYAHTRGRYGVFVRSATRFRSVDGTAQAVESVLSVASSSATPVRLSADQLTASATNVCNIPSAGAQSGRWTIQATQATGTGTLPSSALWTVDVLAARNAAGNVQLAGGGTDLVPTLFLNGGTAWRVSVTADTSTQGWNITGTGEASKGIEWVATFRGVEKTG